MELSATTTVGYKTLSRNHIGRHLLGVSGRPPPPHPTVPAKMSKGEEKKKGPKLGSRVWVRDVDVHNPDVFIGATL